MRFIWFVVVVVTACAAPQAATPVPTIASPESSASKTVATSTPSAKPSSALPSPDPSLALSVRPLQDVPGHAVASPDGKWIAAPEPAPAGKVPYVPAVLLFDTSGKRVAKVDAPGGAYSWRWLPDSSGLYIALDTPQRAAELGIGELDGRVTKTGLQFADPLLSHDGKWIVAEHQEGCCVAIEQKEIWIAPRSGGAPRVLARTRATDRPQPISLLGIDWKDRVVYRDGDTILRVAISGGAISTLASGAEFASTMMGDTSPAALAMLARAFEPARWYWIANDAVIPWNERWGTIVERRQGLPKLVGTEPLWVDPHSVLVTRANGLGAKELVEGHEWAYVGQLENSDLALAVSGQRLIVARGRHAVVIDLQTGRTGDAGIDLGTDISGTLASPMPSGGFVVSTVFATYRID